VFRWAEKHEVPQTGRFAAVYGVKDTLFYIPSDLPQKKRLNIIIVRFLTMFVLARQCGHADGSAKQNTVKYEPPFVRCSKKNSVLLCNINYQIA